MRAVCRLTTEAFRPAFGRPPRPNLRPAAFEPSWRLPRWSWGSISARSIWSARLVHLDRSGLPRQRVGRSGHAVDSRSVPKGRFFPTTRDELIECGAIVKAVRAGWLDLLQMPEWLRDILAKQIVAAAASEEWAEDSLFAMVRRAYPYRDLPRSEFDALITMLSDGIATQRGRCGAYFASGRCQSRRARSSRRTSGGAHVGRSNPRQRELPRCRRTGGDNCRDCRRRLRGGEHVG